MAYQLRTSSVLLWGGSALALIVLAVMADGFIAWNMALLLLAMDVVITVALVGIFFFASKKAVVQLQHMEIDDLAIQKDSLQPQAKPTVEVLSEDAAREWLDEFLVEQQESALQHISPSGPQP